MISIKALPIMLLTLVATPQDATYTLKQKPVAGHESILKMKMNLESSDLNLDMKSESLYKITKVEDDGSFEMETTVLEGTVTLNGEENVIPKGEPEKSKYDKDGNEIKKEGEEQDEDPISEMINVLAEFEPKKAVKVGDTWELKSKYGTLTGKLEGKESYAKIDCLKITVSGKFTEKGAGGTVEGTILLNSKDFDLEKLKFTVENAKLSEEMPEAKFKFELERKRPTS
jgi:hypothetical protein